ncbi:hypothetical protein BVRB_4g087640 [Beta vulgaris subsp. vulgaris]|nr:hypothetical protein BVRB_4g087640 [Beta vulgaris subsp. vulgaris]
MGAKIIYAAILILLCSSVLPSPTTASLADWASWLGLPRLGGWQWPGNNNNGDDELRVGFYDYSCPQAENIIEDVVKAAIYNDPGIAAAFVRLYFHDCFVNGCDASILLDSTPSGEPTEKTSPGNLGVRGFEVIDEIKTRIEYVCPETVSCADILSFATRDAVKHSGIPYYNVLAGRRDGQTSVEKTILGNLPFPNANVKQLDQIFTRKGMNKQDIVALLGAHSIGVAHCSVFEKQFNNFNSTFDINPRLDKMYAMHLKKTCPLHKTSKDDVLPLNIYDQKRLSNVFYSNVINGKVIIPSDQSLLDDPKTNKLVHLYALEWSTWVSDFRDSMIKLGKVDVLTGENGQIRKSCRAVNN